MLIATLDKISRHIFLVIDKFSSKPSWTIHLAFICTILYLLTSFPAFYESSGFKNDVEEWALINEMIENPLKKTEVSYKDPSSNLAKRAFRLTMPVIGHIFGLRAIHLFIIQQITGIFFFILLAKLLEKITSDRVTAVLLVLGFSFIYVGKACFWDIKYGWFDGIAYFLLAAAFLYSNPVFIFVFTFGACWVDERAVLASFFVYYWWKIKEQGIENISVKSLFDFNKSSTAVLIAWITYFVLRFYLGQEYELSTPVGSESRVGLSLLKYNFFKFFPAAILTPIEFFWILLGLAFLVLYKSKYYFQLFLLVAPIGVITLVALSVEDITRSLCYIFPSAFIALYMLQQTEKRIVIRYLALSIVLFNFVVGSYFVLNEIRVISPSFKVYFIIKDWLL